MFHRRVKIETTDTSYSLSNSSIDEVSEQVSSFLTSIGAQRETIIRIRLSVEEVLLRWEEHFDGEMEFHLEMGAHWKRPFIVLRLWGAEFDPLTRTDSGIGLWASELLGTIGLMPVFRYISGCNIVQIPLKRPNNNPGVNLLFWTLAGAILGAIVDLLFPADIKLAFTHTVLTPLQNAFIRTLNAVSAPVMFLSVLTTTFAVGSMSLSGRNGMRMIRRFLLYSTAITAAAMPVCWQFFDLSVGVNRLSQREVAGVLDFLLDIFPGDVMSPIIAGDSAQLILIALVVGNALVIAGAKVQTLVTIVEEANTAGLVIAEWIGSLSPGFVAVLIILGIQDSTIHMLLGVWKPALLIIALSLAALALKMLRIRLRFNVSLRNLWAKMQESFLLSMKTFSVDSSYPANVRCCERSLGIGRALVSYGLPMGIICFMPASSVATTVLTFYSAECYKVPVSTVWLIMALFLSVTLAAAGPPTAGISILTYTVMFSKLNIPAQALTIVLAGDILMGFIIYPVNQALLQLELILEADRLQLLNRETLQSGEGA